MEAIQSLSDQEILTLAKKNPEAFGLLMERYEGLLLSFIRRLTGWGEPEAEDILQETFIKVYRSLNSYDTDLKFSSWLYRIAHNQTIDVLRSEQSRPFAGALSLEEVTHVFLDQTDIEAEFLRREDFDRLQKAIYNLPMIYREVLVLRFLEEKSYDEIIDILKKPKGTIATLIRRGRKILLENIEQFPT